MKITFAIAKGVILLLHGIRANKSAMLDRAEMLYNEGYSSILIDFQGHGESPGEHITVGYLEKYDVLAAIGYTKEKHANNPVAVIGISMGGAAALLAETRELYSKANNPKSLWLVEGLGHEDIHAARPELYKEKVLGFLKQHLQQ